MTELSRQNSIMFTDNCRTLHVILVSFIHGWSEIASSSASSEQDSYWRNLLSTVYIAEVGSEPEDVAYRVGSRSGRY